jgi:hypothetical protein
MANYVQNSITTFVKVWHPFAYLWSRFSLKSKLSKTQKNAIGQYIIKNKNITSNWWKTFKSYNVFMDSIMEFNTLKNEE